MSIVGETCTNEIGLGVHPVDAGAIAWEMGVASVQARLETLSERCSRQVPDMLAEGGPLFVAHSSELTLPGETRLRATVLLEIVE